MLTAQTAAGSRGDATIDQNQFQRSRDALLGEVPRHQLGRRVLVGGGCNDERADPEPGSMTTIDGVVSVQPSDVVPARVGATFSLLEADD